MTASPVETLSRIYNVAVQEVEKVYLLAYRFTVNYAETNSMIKDDNETVRLP